MEVWHLELHILAGVVFIPENGGGAGVRMRDRESDAKADRPARELLTSPGVHRGQPKRDTT